MHRLLLLGLLVVLAASSSGASIVYESDVDAADWSWEGVETESEELYTVISSADGWAELEESLPETAGALPEVDFSKEAVVVAYLGERPTGGYRVLVSRVTVSTQEAIIEIRRRSPGDQEMVTQAFTYPLDVVVLPRDVFSGREISFIGNEGEIIR